MLPEKRRDNASDCFRTVWCGSGAGELYLIAYGSRFSSANPPPQPVDWFEANYPAQFTDLLELEPGFRDATGFDFRLNQSSPMIDAGAFLSQAVGSGSGTVLPVQDASYFYDGYGIPGEVGDEIQLEGSPEIAVVLAADLAADTLTLDRTVSWTDDQGVALAYHGSAPDLGAHELKPSLTLSGIPAPQAAYLGWAVDTTIPVTATWQIAYQGPPGDEPLPITGLAAPTRDYTLTGLTNDITYTITLETMVGSTPILSATTVVMPSDHVLRLPFVMR